MKRRNVAGEGEEGEERGSACGHPCFVCGDDEDAYTFDKEHFCRYHGLGVRSWQNQQKQKGNDIESYYRDMMSNDPVSWVADAEQWSGNGRKDNLKSFGNVSKESDVKSR